MELIGERWSVLILRDMVLGETRFNSLARGLPGLSRTLLAKRLRQLEADGLVKKVGGEYLLTPAGEGLQPVIMGLGAWGARFAFDDEPRPDELDSELLVWWMHARIDITVLPDRRVVLHLRFRGDRKRFWIVVDAGGPSVCTSDPASRSTSPSTPISRRCTRSGWAARTWHRPCGAATWPCTDHEPWCGSCPACSS